MAAALCLAPPPSRCRPSSPAPSRAPCPPTTSTLASTATERDRTRWAKVLTSPLLHTRTRSRTSTRTSTRSRTSPILEQNYTLTHIIAPAYVLYKHTYAHATWSSLLHVNSLVYGRVQTLHAQGLNHTQWRNAITQPFTVDLKLNVLVIIFTPKNICVE